MIVQQFDLPAGQSFSGTNLCNPGDFAVSGAIDVGSGLTLEDFRPSTTHPAGWVYGGVNQTAGTLKTQWWFVCLDMTP